MGVDSFSVGGFAAAHRIEHGGRIYSFSLVDQRVKAEWERRLLERTIQAAYSLSRMKPDGWLESKLTELDEQFMAGEFSLLNTRSLKLLGTEWGVEMLLSILTGLDVTELLPLFAERMAEVKAKLLLILRESFPGIKITESGDAAPN